MGVITAHMSLVVGRQRGGRLSKGGRERGAMREEGEERGGVRQMWRVYSNRMGGVA